jgi:8-oxo-dGTP diphosphatase
MPASDQGVDNRRYRVIPRTLIFATRPGAVLLIQGAAHKRLWAGLFNGVGGHIEAGEDVISSARREFREETGLELSSLWLCGTILVDAGSSDGIAIFVLRGERVTGTLRASAEGTLAWLPVDAHLYELPLVEDLPAVLPRVLAHGRGDPPFSACTTYDEQGRLQITFGA